MSQRLSDVQVAALRDTALGAKYLRDLCDDLREARAALRAIGYGILVEIESADFKEAKRVARAALGEE